MEFAIYFLLFVFIANRMFIYYSHQEDHEKHTNKNNRDSLLDTGLSRASINALNSVVGEEESKDGSPEKKKSSKKKKSGKKGKDGKGGDEDLDDDDTFDKV